MNDTSTGSGLIADQTDQRRRHLFNVGPDLIAAVDEEEAWAVVCAFYVCGRDHFAGDEAEAVPDDELVWLGLEDPPDEWLKAHAVEVRENDGGWAWRVKAPAWVWANEPGSKAGVAGSSEW